ncbi:MAG TPA: bifunctional DNA-formamidopyrimidine glycosylase/DNA-(apurinic or apyrimidinic site) lyase [Sphingomonas sp.]|nr:bifunctional DNA-formamidopyrimidine glycosylase/DNA-(apurinic or apyrimidinic site) lyase [Sphingomonas sp.]
MPELPEVETTVRGLRTVLEGARIAHVHVRRPDMRKPMPPGLAQHLTGATVTGLGRRGKYGLIETNRDQTMIFHLGMSGHWRIDVGEPRPHDHLIVETDGGRTIALNDPRRFGFVDLTDTGDLAAYPAFAAMGPEPLGEAFTGAYLAETLDGRTASIKAALLDQHVVAGVGNIYACEALYAARIAPSRDAGRISRTRLDRLVAAVRGVLDEAIAAGGSSLRDYVRPDGELGYFKKQWRVYGREGEPCGCGGLVRRRTENGRSTFWCPACQR